MTKEKLGTLILSQQDSLYRVARSLLENDADCADAIQEAIVKAFSKIDTLKKDRYAKTWLVRILINECYMIMRKEKKLVSLDSLTEQRTYETQDYSDLYRAVSELPRDLRMAVLLYYCEGFSVKEIAVIEDTSESAVKNRLFKAREKLRKLLNAEEAMSL